MRADVLALDLGLDQPRASCEKCGLHKTCKSPFMLPRGAGKKPGLAIVGEAPGAEEDQRGRPFVGASGNLLSSAFDELGVDMAEFMVTNAVRCRPPNNKLPAKAWERCHGFLIDELEAADPDNILALGGTALRALTGQVVITRVRGQWLEADIPGRPNSPLNGRPVLATFHPAFIMRMPRYLDAWVGDLEKAVERALGLEKESEKVEKLGLDYRVVRTRVEARDMVAALLASDRVAWDIETFCDEGFPKPHSKGAGVSCIQFSGKPGTGWLLPIDHEAAASECELSRAERVGLAKRVLEGGDFPPLRGQNLKYDMSVVRHLLGINARTPTFDCLIAHHLLEEEEGERGKTAGGHGLKALAYAYTPLGGYEDQVEKLYPKFVSAMRTIPLDDLLSYACGDVDVVLRVEDVLAPRIAEEGMANTLRLELMKQDLLVDMELAGIRVDWDYNETLKRAFPAQIEALQSKLAGFPEVRQTERLLEAAWADKRSEKLNAEIAELEVAMAELEGTERAGAAVKRKAKSIALRREKIKALSKQSRGSVKFNPRSTDHKVALYFDVLQLPPSEYWTTGTGAPSTRREAVDEWRGILPLDSPARQIVDNIAAQNSDSKLLGTFVRPLAELAGVDGLIHASYNQAVAVTHRLACSGPNLMNQPRNDQELSGEQVGKGSIKRQFIAGPGEFVAEADYAQIELRVAGLFANDQPMLRCFNEGVDLHRMLAAMAFPVADRVKDMVWNYLGDAGVGAQELEAALREAVSKTMRNQAKGVNFGFIYGISAHSIAAQHPSISLEQATVFVEAARELYESYLSWVGEQRKCMNTLGYTQSAFNHRRHFRNLDILDRGKREAAYRQGANFPIQCTASNLAIYAGAMTMETYKRLGMASVVFGQVHDSLWVRGPIEERDRALALLVDTMENMPFRFLKGTDPRWPGRTVPIVAEAKWGYNLRDLEEWSRPG